jgi:uncharacterized membrane protein HdeD (DUF308 family)
VGIVARFEALTWLAGPETPDKLEAPERRRCMAASTNVPEDVRKHWGWLFALGLAFDLLGVLGLVFTLAFTLAGLTVFGFLLLLGAAAQITQSFRCRDWRGSLLGLLQAALYSAAGILVLADPLAAAGYLTVMLSFALIAIGVVRIGAALKHKEVLAGATMLGLSGLLAVLAGVFILVNWPISGLFAIGLFLSIELMIHGQALLVLAIMARSGARDAA